MLYITIFLISLILVFFLISKLSNINIKSKYNNIIYSVRNTHNKFKTVYKLSKLRNVIEKLLKNIDRKEEIFIKYKERFKRLNIFLEKGNLINEISYFEENTYTLNKYKINLCLKDKDDEFYDLKHLIYIVIHELSHIICPSYGHNDEFYMINRFLLKQAIKLKLLNIIDTNFLINPINYCGTLINEYLL